ncbi:hypothetical protein LCGC14_0809870 [marine sediment metagenome]|uniref:Methyltransferase domain-containing protein n=1 Tax=marine sediment metagenome TaxID=412755 RepID=A0A0F9PM46_9ZZZZ|nr:MAG: SAM-dependent methyltransferase [Candidatus Lokiarchaeum sp. GC14_75]
MENLFGKAIYEYSIDRTLKLRCVKKDNTIFDLDLSYYFRDYEEFSDLEKKAISLADGEILDVGCATGYYIPALKKNGIVDAIDISEEAIGIANVNRIEECHVADIYHYKPSKKYDTITLFENNIGLGGTFSRTKKLIKILATLLKKNGKIIATVRHADYRRKYYSSKYTPYWKGVFGKPFRWFYFNISYLPKFCDKYHLILDIIDKVTDEEGREIYLVKLSNKDL